MPLDPLEALLLVLPAHDEAAAPGRVDVEPDAVLVADVCSIRVISRASDEPCEDYTKFYKCGEGAY